MHSIMQVSVMSSVGLISEINEQCNSPPSNHRLKEEKHIITLINTSIENNYRDHFSAVIRRLFLNNYFYLALCLPVMERKHYSFFIKYRTF